MENKDDKQRDDDRKKAADKPTPRSKLEDVEDEVEYRSISAMSAAPPAFGRALGHMHMNTMPTPFAARKAAAKKPDAQAAAAPSIPMVDATDYASVTPRELPGAPFRLELHSHFHLQEPSLERVCVVIGQKLMDLGGDFVFKANKGKWKVSRVANGAMVEFNVKLYKTGDGKFVVEFQRRQGDIVSMMDMYAHVAEACKKQQLVSNASSLKPLKHKRPAANTSAPIASPAQMKEAVNSIREMMTSKFADVQVQGILASISMTSVAATYLDDMALLVPTLIALTNSADNAVRRCASFALARLCDAPECRRAFMQSDGWELVVKLAAGGPDVPLDLQRESLHALEILCPLYAHELSGADGAAAVLALLQDWQSIPDPRLKKSACGAHRALKAAGMIA